MLLSAPRQKRAQQLQPPPPTPSRRPPWRWANGLMELGAWRRTSTRRVLPPTRPLLICGSSLPTRHRGVKSLVTWSPHSLLLIHSLLCLPTASPHFPHSVAPSQLLSLPLSPPTAPHLPPHLSRSPSPPPSPSLDLHHRHRCARTHEFGVADTSALVGDGSWRRVLRRRRRPWNWPRGATGSL